MSMEMDHSFTVPVPPDRAWDVLLDVKGIAPCMPGATVEEFDGEVVTGRIKVKVGPVSLTYRGTAKFIERDPDAHVVVMEASGKETRGAGTASATVRASLEPESSGEATKVTMHTTMNVTGRPAQFGRGVIVEVGGKLVEKFAENLAQLISGDGAGATAADRRRASRPTALPRRRTSARTARAQASPPARRRPGPGQAAPNRRSSSRSRARRPLRLPSRTRTPSTWSGWSAPRSSSVPSRLPRWPYSPCSVCASGTCSTVASTATRRNLPDNQPPHLAHTFASERWGAMIVCTYLPPAGGKYTRS